jgi:hypothetical protein
MISLPRPSPPQLHFALKIDPLPWQGSINDVGVSGELKQDSFVKLYLLYHSLSGDFRDLWSSRFDEALRLMCFVPPGSHWSNGKCVAFSVRFPSQLEAHTYPSERRWQAITIDPLGT